MGDFDSGKAKAFQGKMAGILNAASLNTLIAIGYKLGIFDKLGENMDVFVSSQELADRAGLNERYVREWLGGVSTGGVLEAKDVDGVDKYRLPKEHAPMVLSSSPDAMAVYCMEMPLLTGVFDDVLANFKTGEGIPYSKYSNFQELMAEFSSKSHTKNLVANLVPGVPGLQDDLTRGVTLCDFGCGRGVAVLALAAAFPNSKFVGFDLDTDAVGFAAAEAARLGLSNASFEAKDVTKGSIGVTPEWITAFDCIHDLQAPQAALNGISRALAPNGRFLMVDIKAATRHTGNTKNPMAPLMYTVSLMHCMPVGLHEGGTGLGAMWGKQQALLMLEEAGFFVDVLDLKFDSFNTVYLSTRKNQS